MLVEELKELARSIQEQRAEERFKKQYVGRTDRGLRQPDPIHGRAKRGSKTEEIATKIIKEQDERLKVSFVSKERFNEVSEDVILEFQKSFEKKYWDSLFYIKENGKYQLNLWEANRLIMLEAGIKEEHISMPGICTCCNPEFLFSHRASHGKRGNLGAFLGIRRK